MFAGILYSNSPDDAFVPFPLSEKLWRVKKDFLDTFPFINFSYIFCKGMCILIKIPPNVLHNLLEQTIFVSKYIE